MSHTIVQFSDPNFLKQSDILGMKLHCRVLFTIFRCACT